MPDRMIRASSCASPNLLHVSGDAERLFWRLTTQADDQGRFRADASLVLAGCFPRAVEYPELMARFSMPAIDGWLLELVDHDLVELYVVDGKRYGSFLTWNKHQRLRNSKGKYPAPPSAAGCGELPRVPQPAADGGTSGEVPLARAPARASGSVSGSTQSAGSGEGCGEGADLGQCRRCTAPEPLDPAYLDSIRRRFPTVPEVRVEYFARWHRQRGAPPDERDLNQALDAALLVHGWQETRAHFARLTDPAMPVAEHRFHTLRVFAQNFHSYGPDFRPAGGPRERRDQQRTKDIDWSREPSDVASG